MKLSSLGGGGFLQQVSLVHSIGFVLPKTPLRVRRDGKPVHNVRKTRMVQSENGDALVNWKAFSTDLSKHAGVRTSNLGYLQAEADLNERVSLARQIWIAARETRRTLAIRISSLHCSMVRGIRWMKGGHRT